MKIMYAVWMAFFTFMVCVGAPFDDGYELNFTTTPDPSPPTQPTYSMCSWQELEGRTDTQVYKNSTIFMGSYGSMAELVDTIAHEISHQ
ncbi:MAG: hypothetical protein E6K53_07545 [Gammaproteobacteria bacterium]|nr:MAG: hypothetical protein E6K53_07545 [Gammaproteobacteria bacterium]